MSTKHDPRLEAAFLAAQYTVHAPQGDIALAIGRHSVPLARLMATQNWASLALITAYNPAGRRQDAVANAHAQQALWRWVEESGAHCMAGHNSAPNGGEPIEPTVAIAGASLAQAHCLANMFGQLAFVFADTTAIPRLIWTDGRPLQQ